MHGQQNIKKISVYENLLSIKEKPPTQEPFIWNNDMADGRAMT